MCCKPFSLLQDETSFSGTKLDRRESGNSDRFDLPRRTRIARLAFLSKSSRYLVGEQDSIRL
jgi:hypothetical protein